MALDCNPDNKYCNLPILHLGMVNQIDYKTEFFRVQLCKGRVKYFAQKQL